MNRRQFHQTVAATAATLALGGELSPAAASLPASLPADPLPVGATARLGCNRLWHLWPASNPGLNDLTFSPDGRYLATLGYQDDHVFIWSVPDGRAVRDWEPQEVDRGGDLLWTEKGLYIASNGGLSLWEPLSGSLIHRYTSECMQGLARSPDRRTIASTSSFRGTVRLWDVDTHQLLANLFAEIDGKRKIFPQQGDFLLSVSFSPCGRWLTAGGYNHCNTKGICGLVHFWDIAFRKHLVRFFIKGGPVGRLAFTPAGRLLTGDWSGTISLWEVPEGRLLSDWPRPSVGNVDHSLAVNASGQIALQREDGVRLWHADPNRETMLCPAKGFSQLAYSDDGRFVAVGYRNGRVDLYDAATGADLSPADRHSMYVDRVELTADGAICLVCLGYPAARQLNEFVLRDTRTGARLATVPPDLSPLALAPVGSRIAGRRGESRLAVWDWTTGDLSAHPAFDVRVVAWHPDGQKLVFATNGETSEVLTWNPATGQGKRQPISSPSPIMALAVAAEGRAVALSHQGDLFVWQLDRDDPPHRVAVPVPTVNREYLRPKHPLALAPDSLSVAVTYGDGIVYAGSVADNDLHAVYTHPSGEEGTEDGHSVVVCYTTAGRLLIAGAHTALRDRDWWYTHFVTDARSGTMRWQSPPQQFWAGALTLFPDGRAILTGHEDGTLLVWPIVSGNEDA